MKLFFVLIAIFLAPNTVQAAELTIQKSTSYSIATSLEKVSPPATGGYSIGYLQQAALIEAAETPFSDDISLSKKDMGGWYILRIENFTPERNWVLQFGKAPFGRQGALSHFGVIDLTRGQVLVNAAPSQKNTSHVAQALLTIDKGTPQVYAIYLTTPRAQNFRGVLTLKPLLSDGFNKEGAVIQITEGLLLALSLSLLIVGLAYNPAAGVCAAVALLFPLSYLIFSSSSPMEWMAPPILLYEGLWMMGAQLMFFISVLLSTRVGLQSLSHVALLMGQIAAVAIIGSITLSNITSDAGLKIQIMTLAPIVPLLASLLIVFQSNMIRTSIGRAATSATIIGLAFYALALLERYIFEQSWQLSLLPWAGVLLQGLCFIRLMFAKGESIFAERMRLESLKLKEAEQLSRLRLSKEAADQSRLMRVIEREREVMEELRVRESQRTEEMRQAKESADEANRAKSAFLAVVSHEIRTPMTGIMGMVRLLLDSKVSGKEREYAQTIKDSSDSMLKLLNDILDFSKIERDSLELEEIEFDLNRSMQNLVRLLSAQAQEKGLLLSLVIDPSLPRYICGDPARLQQVLLNLLNNAIKFTLSGSVTLIVTKMTGGNDGDDNETRYVHNIHFSVQDTGIGIDTEAQKTIFSPFAQADTSITRKFGGTGLGLAISKRLVEAMGGAIMLQSQPDAGSIFSFTLRMNEGFSDQTIHDEKSKNNSLVPPLRILVVEDNNINQRVIREILERMNHEVTLAATGKEGVILAQQNLFDLILMDDELPELKGGEATQIIRTREGPCQEVPIIGLTGNASSEDRARLISTGMNAVLAKPLEPQKLNDILIDFFGLKNNVPTVTPAPSPLIEPTIPDLNIEALAELRQVLGEESLRELVQSLWDKSAEIIDDIHKAVAENDAELLMRKGHEMKGMAGNFGFMALSHAGTILEKAGKTGNIGSAAYIAETMSEQLVEAKAAFEAFLKS